MGDEHSIIRMSPFPLYSHVPFPTFISGVNFKHIKMEKKRLAAIARPPVRGMGEE
jgi:hypothetical protein